MPQKFKFKPVISRVKLNPEQAVLACFGYTSGWAHDPYVTRSNSYTVCAHPPVRATGVNAHWGVRPTSS